jgi:hypothetical protein
MSDRENAIGLCDNHFFFEYPQADDNCVICELLQALEQWKCPACGGSGQYSGYSKEAPNGQPCRKCVDTHGLHPVAFAAIRKVQTA